MKTTLKLSDSYYGIPCKIVFAGRDLSQDKRIEIEREYSNYEVKEIGYADTAGYVFKLSIFNK